MATWLTKEASIKSFIGAQVDALKQVTGELENIYDATDGDRVTPGREHDFQFIQEQLRQITSNLKKAAEVVKAKASGATAG